MLTTMDVSLHSEWVGVDRWKLHCLVSDGTPRHEYPPVVLVHGLGVSSRHMEPAARHFGPRFRVYAPDLPGYGRSPRPWEVFGVKDLGRILERTLDELGVERAVFVSISFGCQIVVELAAEAPERVAACVLVGPTVDVGARNAPSQVLRLLLDAPQEPLSLMPVIFRDYSAFGVRRGAITLWHALADDVVGKLPRIQAPTLIVRGENDPIVPRSWTSRMLDLLPNGSFTEIPGAAHAANFSHPEELARLTESFLREKKLLAGTSRTP